MPRWPIRRPRIRPVHELPCQHRAAQQQLLGPRLLPDMWGGPQGLQQAYLQVWLCLHWQSWEAVWFYSIRRVSVMLWRKKLNFMCSRQPCWWEQWIKPEINDVILILTLGGRCCVQATIVWGISTPHVLMHIVCFYYWYMTTQIALWQGSKLSGLLLAWRQFVLVFSSILRPTVVCSLTLISLLEYDL